MLPELALEPVPLAALTSQAWLLVIHNSDLKSQINSKQQKKGDLFNVAHIREVRQRDPVFPAPQIQ